MGRNISYPNQIAKILVDLSSKFPAVNIGKHIETITCDYGSLEWLSDKELHTILLEYQEKLEDQKGLVAIMDEKDTNELLEDGIHLFDVVENEPEL